MKKSILCVLLGLIFSTQLVSAVPAPPWNQYSLELCNVILNPDGVDGYQLVVFNEDGGNPKIVEEDTCVEGVLYLLPDEIDLDDVEIKEEKNDDFYDGMCHRKVQKWNVVNSGIIQLGTIKSSCFNLDECSHCSHPKTSLSWTDRYKIKYNEDYVNGKKYILRKYKRVDWIDENNLKIDKFKARNDESGEGNPVKDVYDERDIPGSSPEDNRSMLEQYMALNIKIIGKILLGFGCLVVIILSLCIYFKKEKDN